MSGLYPIAGSKIYIGSQVTAKGTVTAADFAGAVWTEIGGWANAGALGDTQNTAQQDLISERRTRNIKTTLNGGTMDNQFVPMANDPGQIKFKEAIQSCNPYQFKVDWGADCAPEGAVTISVADPAVISWTGHGLPAGQAVTFQSTGALPTGITAGTVYYVMSTGLTADTFQVTTTKGGTTAVATTLAGSGTHTATAPVEGMTDMFYGLAMPGARSGGAATAVHLRTWSIAVNSSIVEV